ncbi:MAG: ABC transporter permease/M1 family aminopeptidase [Acidobacteriota bacterium]
MMGRLLLFEVRYWLSGMMVWVFTLVIGGLILAALSTDQITVGMSLENTNRNAPFVVQNYYATVGLLTLLMTTAFVNSAAARDFQYGTHQILFSLPIKKMDFLLGRFVGSALVSTIPMLGISLAALLAPLMPWVEVERFGPIVWEAHLWSIVALALPNTFFVAAFVFAIASWTRSTVTSFLGALLLLVAYIVTNTFTSDLDNEKLAMLLDPFGIQAFNLMTKYWTVAERNTQALGLEGMLLWNRLLWLGVSGLIFAVAAVRFRFSERAKVGVAAPEEERTVAAAREIPAVRIERTGWARQLAHLTRHEVLGVVKTTSFIVLLVAALINTLPTLIFANEGYGNSSYPVTYRIVEVIRGSLYLFSISMIIYYAGLLVWRERDARMDEIEDATPHPAWIRYVSKFTALMTVLFLIQVLMLVQGVAVQAYQGYHRYQLGLYAQDLLVHDFTIFFFLALLAFFVHVLTPNKYVGYFACITFLIVNSFVWNVVDVGTRLVRFGSRPSMVYSDLYGYEPFIASWWWFTAYWGALGLVLAALSSGLWPRGKEARLRTRMQSIGQGPRRLAAAGLVAFLGLGGWLGYNTMVLNRVRGPETVLNALADYERTYKKYQGLEQPRVLSVDYDIAIYPEERRLDFRGDQVITNPHAKPIESLHLVTSQEYRYEIEIEGAALSQNDERLGYRIYRFSPALGPGEKRRMKYRVQFAPRGISNSVQVLEVVQNGTFFNNAIAPQIGYQAEYEIAERNDRKKRGLPEKDLMPKLERNCTVNCRNHYISNSSDWVSVRSRISTSADQIAIAPGTLEREWTEGGRRHFEYRLDRDSLNFYSFISARYEVARETWNGIRTEVYYHGEHSWNVPKMMKSIQKSLAYYTKNFGPYYHRQARIIEFPRVASFAQAFPGTMPYSESVGFIAKLEKPDDIDMVFYVVAHEMAHQWWAHQVVGADMQGATALSEMLAQYSSLMVMEKEYGRDMMRKFLAYEMDRYLRGRGRELLKERPLLTVESSQGYIHYQKGSAAIYYLKEMIGEEAVNRALRRLVEKFAYQPPPYPTSHDLIDLLREETPAELRYLIRDLFEEITLFGNRTLSARASKRPDGKYEVTIEVEAKKFKADDQGLETEIPVDDYIEIGAFAKPDQDKRYGKALYRERLKMKPGKTKYRFVVDQEPEQAGIDPVQLLIDRIPDDNLKKVSRSD